MTVKPRILVVDDEPDVVAFIERTLALEGFETLTAYDGLSALDIAGREHPDLVLLDIMMPMMSGCEVAEQLRSDPQTADIPIVCLTSAHTADAYELSREAGAATLVMKPFLPAELVAQVRRYLPQPESSESED